eukprot:12933016-Prorocentrum_lima.AAC.1
MSPSQQVSLLSFEARFVVESQLVASTLSANKQQSCLSLLPARKQYAPLVVPACVPPARYCSTRLGYNVLLAAPPPGTI